MNLNKVILIGRLTNDPDLRTTPSGQSVTTVSVATNRVWFDQNKQKKEDTEFHSVVVWGRQAETVHQFLKKGALIYVEGRLRTRSWNDTTGNKRKVTEIVAENIQFGPRAQGTGFAPNASAPSAHDNGKEADNSPEEELPVIDIDDTNGIKSEDLPF
ncbi:MAG: single-stranded DNA-binding protein [Patescibacteria group bacterium]|nr:single-stranded DNA-binding protein [Patescibacteria group bacterium]MDE2438015.1 single-stranded DNA-binding protein [Patescibacteria group bacterium]